MNKTEISPFPSVEKKTSKGKRVILSTIKMSLGHWFPWNTVTVFITKSLVKWVTKLG